MISVDHRYHLEAWAPELLARTPSPELDLPLTRRDVLEMFRILGSQEDDSKRADFRFRASRFWEYVTGRPTHEFPREALFFTWGATSTL